MLQLSKTKWRTLILNLPLDLTQRPANGDNFTTVENFISSFSHFKLLQFPKDFRFRIFNFYCRNGQWPSGHISETLQIVVVLLFEIFSSKPKSGKRLAMLNFSREIFLVKFWSCQFIKLNQKFLEQSTRTLNIVN